MIRLNKLLADRGLGARRKCDELIQSGVVKVNGAVVTEPGTQVEAGRDRVEVNGRPLPRETAHVTYMLHKPVGVISTLSDPEGRRSLRDFMPAGARLFPVGRLDADTSGLLLLTNDGDLAHHLMHPRYGVAKRYRVHLDRLPSESQLARLRDGVEFEPGVTSSPAQVWPRDESGDEAVIEIAIHEGRHRQVRRMCEAVGLEVKRLHRYGYGPLKLGDLSRGLWRELSEEEVDALRSASARPAARPGFTGQRSFDRPRVRPRQDRTDRRPGREGFARRDDAGDSAGSRRERGGPRGRGDDRPRRDREEGREHGWAHPPTRVWRAEDEVKRAGGETHRPSGGARPPRPRTGDSRRREGGERGRPPRERTGSSADRPGFERRPARTFDRPARGGFDRAPGRGSSRPAGGSFERRGGGSREGARSEGFGAGARGRDRGGFAPRGSGGRSAGGFARRRGGSRSGGEFAPRGSGDRSAGGFAPRGGGRSGGGFAPRGGGRTGDFSSRGGGRPGGPRGGGFAPRGRRGEPGEGASPARRRFERSPRPERAGRGGFPPRDERGGAGRAPRGARPGERRGASRPRNAARSRSPRRPNS